jgi:hypothetical protein
MYSIVASFGYPDGDGKDHARRRLREIEHWNDRSGMSS